MSDITGAARIHRIASVLMNGLGHISVEEPFRATEVTVDCCQDMLMWIVQHFLAVEHRCHGQCVCKWN